MALVWKLTNEGGQVQLRVQDTERDVPEKWWYAASISIEEDEVVCFAHHACRPLPNNQLKFQED